MGDTLPPFRCREMEETEGDVAFDSEPGEDAALLEDENAPGIGPVHDFAVDLYLSAGGGEETSHGAEQCRFAATGGAKETNKFSFGNFKADVIEHGRAFAIACKHHVDVPGL
jgi:hypothetical protein